MACTGSCQSVRSSPIVDMDLLCLERMEQDSRRAIFDPVIYKDDRVLKNLFKFETAHLVKEPYFGTFQPDIKPYMRHIITHWMLEICDDQECEEQVFPFAVNFLDRFLSVCKINPKQVKLVAVACLLIASKIRMNKPLRVRTLAAFTNEGATPAQIEIIKEMETVVLRRLGWDIYGTTGYDFIDQLLGKVSFTNPNKLLRAHAVTLLGIACTAADLMGVKPSILACGALVSGARGLKMEPDVLEDLCKVVECDTAIVEEVVDKIEKALKQEAAAQ